MESKLPIVDEVLIFKQLLNRYVQALGTNRQDERLILEKGFVSLQKNPDVPNEQMQEALLNTNSIGMPIAPQINLQD